MLKLLAEDLSFSDKVFLGIAYAEADSKSMPELIQEITAQPSSAGLAVWNSIVSSGWRYSDNFYSMTENDELVNNVREVPGLGELDDLDNSYVFTAYGLKYNDTHVLDSEMHKYGNFEHDKELVMANGMFAAMRDYGASEAWDMCTRVRYMTPQDLRDLIYYALGIYTKEDRHGDDHA